MSVTAGYYTIRSIADGTLLDVEGASEANGASLVVCPENTGNDQVMQVVSAGTGHVLIYPVHTSELGYRLGLGLSTGQTSANGVVVVSSDIWSDGQWTSEELWDLETSTGSLTLNGVSYQGHRIKTTYDDDSRNDHYIITPNPGAFGSSRCTVRTIATTLYQQWAFVPAAPYDHSLPTPRLGSSGSSDLYHSSTTGVVTFNDDEGAVFPYWVSKASAHQVRWRRRDRLEQSYEFGEWSDWSTLDSGSKASEGWGQDPTVPTTHITKLGTDTFFSDYNPVPVDFTDDTLRTEVEWNIRAVDASAPAVGDSYTFTTVAARKFRITSVTCTKTPKGLYVSFETTYPDELVQSSNVVGTDGSFAYVSNTTGDTTLFVKNSLISVMPNVGDDIEISLTATSEDGYSARWNGTVEVSLGGTYGDAPTVTCTVNGTIATIQADAPEGMGLEGAWLVIPRGHGDRYVDLGGLETNGEYSVVRQTWVIPPPLGVPWSVLITASSDGRWGYDATVRDAIFETPPTYHVTSQDCRKDFALSLRKSSPGPSFAPTYTRSRTETETYSRERPVYGYSDVTKATWSVTGDLVGGVGVSDADWAAHESHVYFRSPFGFWAQCAVESVSIDLASNESQEVQVSLSEEVW